jgi:8-oxo-dGTP diphosphatase
VLRAQAIAMTLLYTQVHCLRDDQVLLMQRHKEPNLGLWVAPGGKIEAHESPYEGAARELVEETGLEAQQICLRGIVRTVAPARGHSALHFLYAVTQFGGRLAADEREGALRWWPVVEAVKLPMPHANALFMPRVLDETGSFYEARYVYDADWEMVKKVEHTSS